MLPKALYNPGSDKDATTAFAPDPASTGSAGAQDDGFASQRQMQRMMNVVGGTEMFVDVLSSTAKSKDVMLTREAIR